MDYKIDRACFDFESDGIADEAEISNPSLAHVQKLFDSLGEGGRSLMSLHGEDELYLVVGGGAGSYVVYMATPGEEQLWDLRSSAPSNEVFLLTIGGQEGEYSGREVVGKDQAKSAIDMFYRSGGRDAGLNWVSR